MNKPKVNIANLFLEAARAYPSNIAIIEGSSKINYTELADDVKKTAAYFSAKGIKQGDRVLVFVPMSIDLYRIVLALFHIGAAAVFLDEWVSKERLLLCCKIADCKGFIGTPKARILTIFAKELRKIPIKLNWRTKARAGIEAEWVHEDTTALITFTTGSTGIPKAADRSHAFLASQFDILKNKINATPTDVDMPVLPIVLFVNLGVGATSVIAKFNSRKPKTLKPQLLVDQMNRHKVNRITASPFVIKSLAEHLILTSAEVKSVKQIYTGGAPVFPQEAETYLNGFRKAKVTVIYGSTEAEPISSIRAEELVKRRAELTEGLPVGKTHPKTATKIIKMVDRNLVQLNCHELKDLELDDGSIGEVLVSGDHVLKRYYNNPEAFASNKIMVGETIWHRTGDSGKLIDGELYLTGRCKQLIFDGETYVSPFIMENMMQEINGISMGTVIEKQGKVLLVIESELEKNQLEIDTAKLKYDEMIVLKTIPRDPRHFSKIDYPRLMQMVG